MEIRFRKILWPSQNIWTLTCIFSLLKRRLALLEENANLATKWKRLCACHLYWLSNHELAFGPQGFIATHYVRVKVIRLTYLALVFIKGQLIWERHCSNYKKWLETSCPNTKGQLISERNFVVCNSLKWVRSKR